MWGRRIRGRGRGILFFSFFFFFLRGMFELIRKGVFVSPGSLKVEGGEEGRRLDLVCCRRQ